MSKLVRISPKLALPPDVVTSTLVVYGGKGMGKTNLGSVIVEEMTKAGLRWAVLDPLGVWWGLRHSADGKGQGIECLIVGGLHGDLPLEPTAGAVIADLVAEEEDTNVVIDFSRKPSGQMWSMGEKIRFVTEYALRLFQRQGEITSGRRRSPIMQILDESARYIPQVIPSGAIDLAKCVGAWEQITEEGRNVGLGVTFLTQRSARMNKSVSELADAMIAFRIVGPRSIEAVVDWLGAHVEKSRQKDIIEQVRRLPVGQALVVSPGWLDVEAVVQMRMRETFDSSATPKPGERRREPGRAAKPDLEKYKVRMAETIERAKADDPKALRLRIQELEREARKAKPAAAAPVGRVKEVIKRVEVPVLKEGQLARLEKAIQSFNGARLQLDKSTRDASDAVNALAGTKEQMLQLLERARGATDRPARETVIGRDLPAARLVPMPRSTPTPRPLPTRPARPAPSQPSEGVSSAQQRMLNALRWLEEIGIERAERPQLGLLARMKFTTGHFKNELGGLRTQSLVEYPTPGLVVLTDEGRSKAVVENVPQTSDELQDQVLDMVTGLQKKMLEHLIHAYPRALSREDLGEAIGVIYTTGHFKNELGGLRTMGVVDYPTPGQVVALPVLFLEGR